MSPGIILDDPPCEIGMGRTRNLDRIHIRPIQPQHGYRKTLAEPCHGITAFKKRSSKKEEYRSASKEEKSVHQIYQKKKRIEKRNFESKII